jgi:hypothetical protein
MNYFDKRFFQKTTFSLTQIKRHYNSALRDLTIAKKSDVPEVVFKFSYDALIKLGIALIAKAGYKVRSQAGHHIKILEKLSQILSDENIAVLGNKMRQDRNFDLYCGGTFISQKSSQDYLKFIMDLSKKIKI